jgi:hypothetical protein
VVGRDWGSLAPQDRDVWRAKGCGGIVKFGRRLTCDETLGLQARVPIQAPLFLIAHAGNKELGKHINCSVRRCGWKSNSGMHEEFRIDGVLHLQKSSRGYVQGIYSHANNYSAQVNLCRSLRTVKSARFKLAPSKYCARDKSLHSARPYQG